jgi:hypothetical protein
MPKTPRIDNEVLVTAGLDTMGRIGKPLTKIQGFGRAMMYSLPNGERVRVRTCNDHILIVVADSPAVDAKLNIEGTEWLLIVMPEVERTPGKIMAYLVPTQVAVEAARLTHRTWLETNPNTRGSNTTWNLWFDENSPSKANDFANKWKQYLLNSDDVRANEIVLNEASQTGSVKAEVEAARQRISKAAGVSPSAVKITIEFGA